MIKSIHVAAVFFLACALLFTACEGPLGPAGEQGIQGGQGPIGEQGPIGPDGSPAFPNGMSLNAIVESRGGQWVDITDTTAIDTSEYFTFADGTIDGTSDIGILTMNTDSAPYPYAFQETTATTGTLLVELPAGEDWSLTPVATYVFNRTAGTLTFTDAADLEAETFGNGKTYAIDRTDSLPELEDGDYSYTNGSGIEIAKREEDTEKGTITASSNALDFSDTDSIFGDFADKSSVALSWLGNVLYGTENGNVYVLVGGLSGVTAASFVLDGKTYELQEVPDDLTSGGTSGMWTPKNASEEALGSNNSGAFKDIKFASGGALTYDTTTNVSADVDPFTVGFGDFYVLGGNQLYIAGERFASYAIDKDDKLTFADFAVGEGYGTFTYSSPNDGVIAYFE